MLKSIDNSALIVSQTCVILLNLAAFVLDFPWLVLLTAGFMWLGTLLGRPGFGWVYQWALRPLGLVRARLSLDHPEPHRFAQGFGAVVLSAAGVSLFLGAPLAGWLLVGLVTVLAALNAFGGFCLGCFVYYWLARIGVPGFSKQPPAGTFPGARPKEEVSNER